MRIENAAKEYIDGKIQIVLEKNKERKDDLEFELLVPLLLKVKLETVQYEIQDKNSKKKTEDVLTEQMDVLRLILEKSYPTMTKEWSENVLMKYGHELLLELFFVWGWRDREAYQAMVEAKKKMISDLKANPQKIVEMQSQGTGN